MTENFTTKRSTVPELEEILGKPIKILDHGFIRVIDYMGDDSAIVQAARVSYGKGTKKLNEDKGLIHYLLRHSHTTPFEMCEIKFHIKLPIFVARQWIRHRTANVNEYSGRYSILDKEFYIPEIQNIQPQSASNKQGRSSDVLSNEEINRVLEILQNDSEKAYEHYLEMLNLTHETSDEVLNPDRLGIARELARVNLPVNFYTQWYWKIDLHNLMHFLRLRADPHAQFEIREYAIAMVKILKLWMPHTYEAFENYHLNSCKLSGKGKDVVKRMINGEKISQQESGMSVREWNEMMDILGCEDR